MTRSPWSTRPPHRCWFAVRTRRTLEAMVFLEAEGFRLSRLAACIWRPRSALPTDLPIGINALRVARTVNTYALVLPLRHTAPKVIASFPKNIFFTIPPSGNGKLRIENGKYFPFCIYHFPSLQKQDGEEQRLERISTVTFGRSLRGTGILTCCPSATPFGLTLGSTNPTPITVAWETLGIRWAGFSPA